ncbi:MAG: phosphatase PAP2 family protein [Bacteroidales bacterium]
MLFKGKISCLFINFVVLVVVFIFYSIIAYPQKPEDKDFFNTIDDTASKPNRNIINYQKPLTGFYKTDSIFSFQSKKGYIPSLLYDFGEQVTAPFRFKTKQWLITGATVGITITLLHFDNDIDKWARVQKQQHGWVNKSSPVITLFGSTYGISTVAAIGLISAVFNKQKGVETSLLATQALITSGAWVQLIKHLTGREDPSASYIYSKIPGGKWWGPFAQYDQDLPVYKSVSSFDAFPSGHTAAAFSIATVFASQYNSTNAIPVLSYSMATLVGISRLIEHQHWASDVFVGGLIGYLCGKQAVANYNKLYHNQLTPLSSKYKIKKNFTLILRGNQGGFFIKW